MAKGDVVLTPVALEAKDPAELAKLVVLERIKRDQHTAIAHYTSTYVKRFTDTPGFTRYVAFVEFFVEEK